MSNAHDELDAATRLLMSAVACLRDIAALQGTSKRQRANSEIAATWLLAHGFALEEGGYIPGKGFEPDAFECGQRAAKHAFGGIKELLRRQHKALKLPRAPRDHDMKQRPRVRDQ